MGQNQSHTTCKWYRSCRPPSLATLGDAGAVCTRPLARLHSFLTKSKSSSKNARKTGGGGGGGAELPATRDTQHGQCWAQKFDKIDFALKNIPDPFGKVHGAYLSHFGAIWANVLGPKMMKNHDPGPFWVANNAHLIRFGLVLTHLNALAARILNCLWAFGLGRKDGRFWAPKWSKTPFAKNDPQDFGMVKEATGPILMLQWHGSTLALLVSKVGAKYKPEWERGCRLADNNTYPITSVGGGPRVTRVTKEVAKHHLGKASLGLEWKVPQHIPNTKTMPSVFRVLIYHFLGGRGIK